MYKRAYTLCLLLVVLLGSATVETRGQTLESQTSHETVQGIRFTGKVVDTDGEPVPGAGVVCNEKIPSAQRRTLTENSTSRFRHRREV